jgi:hypothetical protein
MMRAMFVTIFAISPFAFALLTLVLAFAFAATRRIRIDMSARSMPVIQANRALVFVTVWAWHKSARTILEAGT